MKSTILFWIGLFLALIAIILQLLIPGAQLVLFLVAVIGLVLTGWQKVAGDNEHRQELKRIRAEAQSMAINSTELRIESNLTNRAPNTIVISSISWRFCIR